MTYVHQVSGPLAVREGGSASSVLEAALSDPARAAEAADVMIGLALNGDDPAFVEAWCVKLGRELPPGSPLLGAAGLCLGHLARRFGHVSDEAALLVMALADRSKADPADVDPRAQDGLDDIVLFTGRRG